MAPRQVVGPRVSFQSSFQSVHLGFFQSFPLSYHNLWKNTRGKRETPPETPAGRKPPLRKGRWHGAAVTEGSIRLDVLTKPGSTGKLGRSLSQPAADSSLYAREPPHPSRATPGPPSPEGKAASGGGLPSTCYVAFWLFLQGILPQAVTQLWKGAVGEGDIHKNTPQLFYKLWRNFLGFPGGSGGRAGERGG